MKANNKQPTHSIFQVIEREKNTNIWTRVGAAWPHEKGEGFTLIFNAIPLTGRIVLLKKPSEEKEA
jgi:hypothetical protein